MTKFTASHGRYSARPGFAGLAALVLCAVLLLFAAQPPAQAAEWMEPYLEQVQDFTPTPMTVATEIYYTGIHPYTGEKVYTARTRDEKLAQRQYFFWYDKTYRPGIIRSLNRLHRPDLIAKLYPPYKKSTRK